MDNIYRKFYGGGTLGDPSFGVFIDPGLKCYDNNKTMNSSIFKSIEDVDNVNPNLMRIDNSKYNIDKANNIGISMQNQLSTSNASKDNLCKSNNYHNSNDFIKVQFLEQKLLNLERQQNEDKQAFLNIINENILNIKPHYYNNQLNDDNNKHNKKVNFVKDDDASNIYNNNTKDRLLLNLNENETKKVVRDVKEIKEDMLHMINNEEQRSFLRNKELLHDMNIVQTELLNKLNRLEDNRKTHLINLSFILENSGSNRVKSMTRRLFGNFIPKPEIYQEYYNINNNNSKKDINYNDNNAYKSTNEILDKRKTANKSNLPKIKNIEDSVINSSKSSINNNSNNKKIIIKSDNNINNDSDYDESND